MILGTLLIIIIYKFVPLPNFIYGTKEHSKMRMILLLIVLIVSLIFFVLLILVNFYSKSDKEVKEALFGLKVENVKYIKIVPYNGYNSKIGQMSIIVKDTIFIKEFIKETGNFHDWQPNSPSFIWEVYIEFKLNDNNNVQMSVGCTETNEVAIYLDKDEPFGGGGSIRVAIYRNDNLGELIENKFKKQQ